MRKTIVFVLAALMLTATPAFSQTSAKYYVDADEQETGPYDIAALENMVETGALTAASLICKEGTADWTEAGTIPEVSRLFADTRVAAAPLTESHERTASSARTETTALTETPARAANSAQPESPALIPDKILSAGTLSIEQLETFLLARNPALAARRADVKALIAAYIEYANRDGVNYEIAFAQMCHHTRYLSYKNTFLPEGAYNYAGFTAPKSPYQTQAYRFNSLEDGVKAHIQHLKGYASEEPPAGVIVDPRYAIIKEEYGLGSSPTLAELEGKWSPEKGYGRALQDILSALHETVKK
jgi:hypothetical protein